MHRTRARRRKSTNVRFEKRARRLGRQIGWLSFVAPRLAVGLAEQLFLRTRRYARPEVERALLAEGARGTAVSAGRTLRVWSYGRGPTVLLVHGWNGRGAQLGAFVAPLVRAGYRAVLFDAAGHGDSQGNTASMPGLAADIEAVAASYGPLHGVIAHSVGGLATALALSRGLHARRVVTIGAPAYPVQWFEHTSQLLGLQPWVRARLQRRFERRFGGSFEQMAGPRLVAGLGTSALVIHDRDDREVPLGDSEALARAWPGARLERTVGLGHRRILTDETVVSRALCFIEQGDARRAALAGLDD